MSRFLKLVFIVKQKILQRQTVIYPILIRSFRSQLPKQAISIDLDDAKMFAIFF